MKESPSAPSMLTLELLLGTLTAFAPLSIDMYLPAFPAIGRDLIAGPADVELTLASFFVGLSLGQLATGPMIDRLGRTRPLYAGLLLYVLGSIGCALATSIMWLAACRSVQALGGAVGIVVARAVVRDLHAGAAAARMLSRLVLVMGVAPILGPLLGGFVLQAFGWRAIFGVLATIATATLVAVVIALPETLPADARQARFRLPIGDVLRAPDFLGYALAVAGGQAAMFAYISGASYVFITLHGIPAQSFGWFFGANAAGLVTSSQVNHRLLARITPARILRHALPVAVLAAVLLIAAAGTGVGGIWSIAFALFLFVSSLGFIVPNATALALEHQIGRVGSASAVLGTMLYGIAAGASWSVSAAHNGTALPMAIAVTTFASLAWASLALTQRPASAGVS